MKIRACFTFHKCVPVLAFLFIGREKEKVMMESQTLTIISGFFPLIVAENSSQTLYSIDCQCINRRKSSRVVRHFKFSAYYVMITYLYDALSFLKHFSIIKYYSDCCTCEYQCFRNAIKLMFQNWNWHEIRIHAQTFAFCHFSESDLSKIVRDLNDSDT